MLAERRGRRMMEIISWLVAVYAIVSFIMAFVAIATNYKMLKNLNWWKQILFFALQPILIIREGMK